MHIFLKSKFFAALFRSFSRITSFIDWCLNIEKRRGDKSSSTWFPLDKACFNVLSGKTILIRIWFWTVRISVFWIFYWYIFLVFVETYWMKNSSSFRLLRKRLKDPSRSVNKFTHSTCKKTVEKQKEISWLFFSRCQLQSLKQSSICHL